MSVRANEPLNVPYIVGSRGVANSFVCEEPDNTGVQGEIRKCEIERRFTNLLFSIDSRECAWLVHAVSVSYWICVTLFAMSWKV